MAPLFQGINKKILCSRLTDSRRLPNIPGMMTELTKPPKPKIEAIMTAVSLCFFHFWRLEEVGTQPVDTNLSDRRRRVFSCRAFAQPLYGSDSIRSPSGPEAIGHFDGGEP